jgi:hypothetical protein
MATDVEAIVGPYPDAADVLGHGFDTKPWWWTSTVETTVFERMPVSPERGEPWRWITRGDLFAIAADSTASAVDLLVACYAWGMGPSVGNLRRYRLPLRQNSLSAICARVAGARSVLESEGPLAAYRSFGVAGPNKLVRLGPSFYTKVLYAAGGLVKPGNENALILDQFVVIGLNDLAQRGIETGQVKALSPRVAWRGADYRLWLEFAHREADRASEPGRPVRADAVEMALFRHGRNLALGH